jgi:hypothetical protein
LKERGEKLIEMFIYEYEQAKILIYWMRNIFICLDNFYTKSNLIGTLCLNALKLCHSSLFLTSKEHLFDTLKIMIEADRNNEVVDRTKIRRLFRILEEIDIKVPELKKKPDGTLFWIGEKTKIALSDWFEKEFKKDVKGMFT